MLSSPKIKLSPFVMSEKILLGLLAVLENLFTTDMKFKVESFWE